MLNSLFSKKQSATQNSAASVAATFTLEQLTTLAIEHWRLTQALGDSAPAPARHALRKIEDLLKSAGIETQSLDNHPHDPGMSAQVIDRVIDPRASEGDIIIETLSPLVTFRGQAIKPAEVVVGTAA